MKIRRDIWKTLNLKGTLLCNCFNSYSQSTYSFLFYFYFPWQFSIDLAVCCPFASLVSLFSERATWVAGFNAIVFWIVMLLKCPYPQLYILSSLIVAPKYTNSIRIYALIVIFFFVYFLSINSHYTPSSEFFMLPEFISQNKVLKLSSSLISENWSTLMIR